MVHHRVKAHQLSNDEQKSGDGNNDSRDDGKESRGDEEASQGDEEEVPVVFKSRTDERLEVWLARILKAGVKVSAIILVCLSAVF